MPKNEPQENASTGTPITLANVVMLVVVLAAIYAAYQYGVSSGYKNIVTGAAAVREYKSMSGSACKAVLVGGHHRVEECPGESANALGGLGQ